VAHAVAHQRKIADREREQNPRERLTSLDQFFVDPITREQAKPIILKYEWLANIGRADHFVGLFSPERVLIGVACFGYGPADKSIRELLEGPAWCLERGTCVPHAPKNAASFLITHACKLMYGKTGISRFFAYGDPEAVEYGGVYQAANWLYLGQGLNGGKGRTERYYTVRPGLDPTIYRNRKTTWDLRRPGKRHLSFEEARAAGWIVEKQAAKHVYAINVGRDAKKWRKRMKPIAKPRPKPRPELARCTRCEG
jgi:hypothetical protein